MENSSTHCDAELRAVQQCVAEVAELTTSEQLLGSRAVPISVHLKMHLVSIVCYLFTGM